MSRSLGLLVVGALVGGAPVAAHAQAVKPRFVLILDTSSSMVENPSSADTIGDGSVGHEGCDLDNSAAADRYAYDDSRLYQAKGAIADTIAAFGSAEFTLARFTGINLGQACTTTADCPIDPAHRLRLQRRHLQQRRLPLRRRALHLHQLSRPAARRR